MNTLERIVVPDKNITKPLKKNKKLLKKAMIPILSLFLMLNTQNIHSKTQVEKKLEDNIQNVELINYDVNSHVNINSSYSLGFSFGTNGLKLNANINLKTTYHSLNQDLGLGVSYYTNFYQTQKKGLELRLSSLSTYNFNKDYNLSLGTNYWIGLGELKEFNQQTALIKGKINCLSISYEQDGSPFDKLLLSDGCDRYRTTLLNFVYKDINLRLKLFTGNRDLESYEIERKTLHGGSVGKSEGYGRFGEFYQNGIVYEKGKKYRYGSLGITYQNYEVGINSEWIRHFFQNQIAHNRIVKRRQFIMTNSDIKPVFNYEIDNHHFSYW